MRQSKLRLSFIRVETWEDALDLMDVRNSCRNGMTHFTDLITVKEQSHFYRDQLSPSRGLGEYEAYLLRDDSSLVGYGLLKWDVLIDGYWMTAGIVPEYRGKKLSKFLISYITEMGHREGADVWIDVWKDNLALIGDIRVGYEVIKEKEVNGRTLLIMRHNRNRLIRLREQMMLEEMGKTPHPGREFVKELAEVIKEASYDPTREMVEVDRISKEFYR